MNPLAGMCVLQLIENRINRQHVGLIKRYPYLSNEALPQLIETLPTIKKSGLRPPLLSYTSAHAGGCQFK